MSKPIHVKPSLYAYYFQDLKEIALEFGYNLVLHGSLNRDLDLVAIPWSEKLGSVRKMIEKMTKRLGGEILLRGSDKRKTINMYGEKPHGRIVYVININREHYIDENDGEYKHHQYYLDISVTPVVKQRKLKSKLPKQ
jgi:hypothetical protein